MSRIKVLKITQICISEFKFGAPNSCQLSALKDNKDTLICGKCKSTSDMGFLQLFIDAGMVSIVLAAARRKGCVTFNLTKYPQTEQGRRLVQNYLLFGEKVVDFFSAYKIPKKR